MNAHPPSDTPVLESIGEPSAKGGGFGLWLVLLVTLLVYWASLDGALVYDDLALIGENPLISDLSKLPELILRPLWDFQNPGSAEQTGYWRPLTSVVYSLSWAVDGGAPWVFHGASVLFHLLATSAAFLLARRLSGKGWLAVCLALLFGLHPVHVESVAWISALNDPLFATFVLFSLASFLRWRQAGSNGAPILAAVFFGLALLSKEMGLALLPLLVIVDCYAGRPIETGESRLHWFQPPAIRKRAYLPYGVVLAAYLGMRMWVFSSPKGGFDRVITHFGVTAERMALLRVELWGKAMELLFWPTELHLFRPFQPNLSLADSSARWALGLCIISLLVLLALWILRKRSLFFAFLLLPISFAPVLWGADAVGLFPCSDRYLYLAVFGSSLFSLLLLHSWLPRRAVLGVTFVIAVCFGKQSYDRSLDWHNELQLFGSEVRAEPRSPYVYWGFGRVLLNEYSRTLKPAYLRQAKQAFENSQALLEEAKEPSGADIFASSNDYLQANLGYAHCFIMEEALFSEGSAQTAVALLNNLLEAVGKIHQEAEEARSAGKTIRGFLPPIELIFAALGAAHFSAGDMDAAAEALTQSLALNPRNPQALKTLAKVDFANGNRSLAIQHLRRALELSPRNGDLQLALAQILQDSDQTAEAQQIAQRLLEIMPEHPGPLWVLADALMAANKPREALIRLYEAQKLDEFNGHTWLLIAQALATIGTDADATLDAFQKAAQFKSGDVNAQYNLAALLYGKGEFKEAIPHFVFAYGLTESPQTLASLRQVLPQLPYPSPAPLMGLMQADKRRKEFDLMEFWLGMALGIDPDYVPALMESGQLLVQRGRVEEGLQAMARACSLAPGFLRIVELGKYQSEAGLISEAKDNYERAKALLLDQAPVDPSKLELVEKLLAELKSTQAAAAQVQQKQ